MRDRFVAAFFLAGAMLCAAAHPVPGEESRPSPFAAAEAVPTKRARCHEIRDLIRDRHIPEDAPRVDFGASGALTLVEFDGVLAYLGICREPDVKVLCVTYAVNDMKLGEVVNVTGGYQKMNDDLIVLDPCLAARPDPAGD